MTLGRILRLVIAGTALAVLVGERLRPLRRHTERPAAPRLTRNAIVTATGLIASAVVETTVVRRVGPWADRRRLGLVRRLPLPPAARAVAGFLALDYSLFLWHVANHRVQGLWRFHLVHHVDRDLDASTGLRFHFGELSLTALLRAVQIVVLGVDVRTLALWQRLLVASVLFHHSNLRLPIAFERALSTVVVTPRMHGIHHSEIREETDSNYSSLLSIWDRLHRTLLLNVPQDVITIGVPAYRDPARLKLLPLLRLPFEPMVPSWEPTAGIPPRQMAELPTTTLAE